MHELLRNSICNYQVWFLEGGIVVHAWRFVSRPTIPLPILIPGCLHLWWQSLRLLTPMSGNCSLKIIQQSKITERMVTGADDGYVGLTKS